MSDNIFSKIPDINQIINKSMQLGNWEDALTDVSKFLVQYPEHEEAIRLKNQIELMVQLDTGEKDDHDSHRKQMIVKTILGISGILLFLVIVYLGFQRLVAELETGQEIELMRQANPAADSDQIVDMDVCTACGEQIAGGSDGFNTVVINDKPYHKRCTS